MKERFICFLFHCGVFLRYTTPCSNMPTLKNGLPNTEKTMHALQTAFGMMCVQNSVKNVPVKGCVIVTCTDGAKLYWVPNSLAHADQFTFTSRQTNPTCKKDSIVGSKLLNIPPEGSPGHNALKSCLGKLGGTYTHTNGRFLYGSSSCGRTTLVLGSIRKNLGMRQKTKAVKHVRDAASQVKGPGKAVPCLAIASPSGFIPTIVGNPIPSS